MNTCDTDMSWTPSARKGQGRGWSRGFAAGQQADSSAPTHLLRPVDMRGHRDSCLRGCREQELGSAVPPPLPEPRPAPHAGLSSLGTTASGSFLRRLGRDTPSKPGLSQAGVRCPVRKLNFSEALILMSFLHLYYLSESRLHRRGWTGPSESHISCPRADGQFRSRHRGGH